MAGDAGHQNQQPTSMAAPQSAPWHPCRRKSRQVEADIKELGDEGIEERMRSGVQVPADPKFRFARMVGEKTTGQVRPGAGARRRPGLGAGGGSHTPHLV